MAFDAASGNIYFKHTAVNGAFPYMLSGLAMFGAANASNGKVKWWFPQLESTLVASTITDIAVDPGRAVLFGTACAGVD
jgi:hypothetical protein